MEFLRGAAGLEIMWQKLRLRRIGRSFKHWHLVSMQESVEMAALSLEAMTKQYISIEDEYERLRSSKSLDFLAKTVQRVPELQGIPVSRAMITVAFGDFTERVRDVYDLYREHHPLLPSSSLTKILHDYQLVKDGGVDSQQSSVSSADLSFHEFLHALQKLVKSQTANAGDILDQQRAAERLWKRLSHARTPKSPPTSLDTETNLLDVLERETQVVEQVILQQKEAVLGTDPLVIHVVQGYDQKLASVFAQYAVKETIRLEAWIRFLETFGLVPSIVSQKEAQQAYQNARHKPLVFKEWVQLLCEFAQHLSPDVMLSKREMLLTLLFHIGIKTDEVCYLPEEIETALWVLFQHYATQSKLQGRITMTSDGFSQFLHDLTGPSSNQSKHEFVYSRISGPDSKYMGFEQFCQALGQLQQMEHASEQQNQPLGDAVSAWISQNILRT